MSDSPPKEIILIKAIPSCLTNTLFKLSLDEKFYYNEVDEINQKAYIFSIEDIKENPDFFRSPANSYYFKQRAKYSASITRRINAMR